jgi:two-component system sensor histidine kinase UhpB
MKRWMQRGPNGRSQGARRDLIGVALASVAAFMLASAWQLQERLAALTESWEAWQLDELPLALLALCAGLAWFAGRRHLESARLLADNRLLAQRLIELQELERRALARELHDELGQHCTALRLEAACMAHAGNPQQATAAVQRAASTAELMHEGVHRLLRRLRPAELDELGLPAALQALCEYWESRSHLHCALRVRGPAHGFGEATDTALYRVAQEALSNAVRHAHAQRVSVSLQSDAQGIELRVQDDGCGMAEAGRARPHGLGLLGASERAAGLGGSLELQSQRGQGTCVVMRLPRAPAAAVREAA